ncbi:DEAD/DEAH box helicase [Foetidibacter luteolus]|uniref:DEAD/DEAH box helicase n=1 Tax=Foetidibacter luteolus TaxID=2608880 RepID=UPI00129B4522|nr:DEAD/DEAH box helicase [Foetidibacter luteolus]
MTFKDLGLNEAALKAVEKKGYTTPTPIQQQAIPAVLNRKDILGCAQTGTGKTAAFALPVLQLLHQADENRRGYKHIRALVLAPTRELALQIAESFTDYGSYTGLKHTEIYGGVPQHSQVIDLRNGTDILIATPGRLLDLINQGYIYLDYLEFFILDEADRMLDMGFIDDIRKIIKMLPDERQTLFFSATFSPQITRLADSLLTNPEKIEITPVSSAAEKIQQFVYMVGRKDKPRLLQHLLKQDLVKRTIVFTRTKHGADRIVQDLKKANLRAGVIHGNKSQEDRQYILNKFKEGRINILVATDIASRGIDIDNISHVINYDVPDVPETYVHRIGRTGRAGEDGVAFSLCDKEERGNLRDIRKIVKADIVVVEGHPYQLKEGPQQQNGNNNRPKNHKKKQSPKKHHNHNRPNAVVPGRENLPPLQQAV